MRRSISMGCIGIFGALALGNEPSGKSATALGRGGLLALMLQQSDITSMK